MGIISNMLGRLLPLRETERATDWHDDGFDQYHVVVDVDEKNSIWTQHPTDPGEYSWESPDRQRFAILVEMDLDNWRLEVRSADGQVAHDVAIAASSVPDAQAKATEFVDIFEEERNAPEPQPYVCSWLLTDGRVFRLPLVALSTTDAAEQFFQICNGIGDELDVINFLAMNHRNMDVGDQITVDGKHLYNDLLIGWRPASPVDPKTMEERDESLGLNKIPNQGSRAEVFTNHEREIEVGSSENETFVEFLDSLWRSSGKTADDLAQRRDSELRNTERYKKDDEFGL